MRKITIGRGRECDVRLDDSTDMVSRRQAVMTVSFFGKMRIYDTSSNGTFVNGERVGKPEGMPVRRGDQVNFAHIADLDWSKVRDPYRALKMSLCLSLAAVIAVAAVIFIFSGQQSGNNQEAVEQSVTETVSEDTIVPPDVETPAPAFDKGNIPDTGVSKERKRGAAGKRGYTPGDQAAKEKTDPEIRQENLEPEPVVNDPSVDRHLKDK